MSQLQTMLLGVVAGLAILLGPPLARPLLSARATARVFLTAFTGGLLVFMLWHVLYRAFVPLNGALLRFYDDMDDSTDVWTFSALFLGGLLVGYGILIWIDASTRAKGAVPPFDAGTTSSPSLQDQWGPGAGGGSVATHTFTQARPTASRPDTGRLAMSTAIAVGLHNLCEGLGIGNNGAYGWIAITTMLVVAVVFQNVVAGFALAAPFVTGPERAGGGRLTMLALIAGVPTILGTYLGWLVSDIGLDHDMVDTAMQAVAGGAILCVLLSMFTEVVKLGHRTALQLGLLTGLTVAFFGEILLMAGSGA
ncbi:hypothetical protein [Pseudonocardia spinosispora]|uniref:hypothetical protein n=1 Tax=Pseudonocardia spinosispora TaxID=103441 RepID=UPI00040E89C2|nr:hypothetical protein [Pseudonocardia spinosispora]